MTDSKSASEPKGPRRRVLVTWLVMSLLAILLTLAAGGKPAAATHNPFVGFGLARICVAANGQNARGVVAAQRPLDEIAEQTADLHIRVAAGEIQVAEVVHDKKIIPEDVGKENP